MKILVAEDDKFLSNAYRVKFDKQSWDVTIVSNGVEVLEYLTKNTPDILLLDLIMPQMDGFQVLEILKTDKYPTKFPIIIASNLGQHDDISRALALGAIDFIVKSETSLDTIVTKIKKLVDK